MTTLDKQIIIKSLAFLVLAFFISLQTVAACTPDFDEPDTIIVEFDDSPIGSPTGAKMIGYKPLSQFTFSDLNADSLPIIREAPWWLRHFVNSWTQGDVDRTRDLRADLSFAVSPSYTREASFGIGGAVTALYRVDRADTLAQPSMAFASLNASLNGFYIFRTRGNVYFPDDKWRLNYNAELSRRALHFWGVTALATSHNKRSKYDRRQIDCKLELTRRIANDFHLGPFLNINHTNIHKVDNPEYLGDLPRSVFVAGVGLSAIFDSRDNANDPKTGFFAQYRPVLFPAFLSSAHNFFHSHLIQFNYYKSCWPGAVVATDLYAKLNSKATPWTMKEMIASDGIRMRGYYMGSYVDNNQISAQIELRQHIWDRLGINAWCGMASLFPKFGRLDASRERRLWLPNYGIGLRFQFKYRVNARIDCGFGRHTMGLLFAVGEAF